MATRLRVLLHHNPKRRSHALLAQAGVLDQAVFTSTCADFAPEDYMPQKSSLTLTRMDFDPRGCDGLYVPRLNNFQPAFPAKSLPLRLQVHRLTHKIEVRRSGRGWQFDAWWKQPVLRNMHNNSFTRSDLVLVTANQDGGAHFDPSLDAMHHALTRGNSMGMFAEDVPFESPVPPALRQITWELHAALAERRPEMLELLRPDERVLASAESL
ncbi:hypothetical protein [Nocardioides hwasunensis]|uniref:Uncharacterized protein n=1 Tax=Nocardioides hwasunensis TaxID=397258 RepID=A0ABR8MP49_9ACTN|nr:hypothetical protein [Nocardioides hwasunensis]MBD3915889.1 hypothetical protein [Nocardioides hwasunensis]